MPIAAPKPCRAAGCPALVPGGGFCDAHRRDYWRTDNANRKQEAQFYGSRVWKATRAAVLRSEPLCRLCDAAGRVAIATVVDHIRPVLGGGDMFDRANLQPLCERCHSAKRQAERGDRQGRGGANP